MRSIGLPVLALVVVASWLLLPIVQTDVPAQDAVPLHVAGDLVGEQPDAVYNEDARGLYDLTPAFRERTCRAFDDLQSCLATGVAFISPPLALSLVAPLARLDLDAAVFLVRVFGAACMAAGFVLLVRRLDRPEQLVVPITLAAALFVFEVAGQTELGQTSPLLFLLACLPVSRLRGRQAETGIAVLVALAVAFKGFPAVLLVPMVVARRWRLAAMTAGGVAILAVASLIIGSGGLWSEFVDLSRAIAEVSDDNPYNAASGAVADALGLPGGAAFGLVVGCVILVAFVAGVLAVDDDEDLRWAATIPAALLVVPQVWGHYLATAVAMVVVAAAPRSKHPERWLLGSVAALVPVSLGSDSGVTSQTVGFVALVASLAVVAGLVRGGRRARSGVPVPVT